MLHTVSRKKIFAVSALICAAVLLFSCVGPEGSVTENKTAQGSGTFETAGTAPQTNGSERPTAEDSDEIRGVFVTSVGNVNFPSKPGLSERQLKEELDAIVANAVLAGLNTVYLQVRPSGDALYDSAIFPTSRYLKNEEGAPIGFDPLPYFTEICREANVSPVAWVNPYRVTSVSYSDRETALGALSENNPARQHPDWCVFYGGRLYYDPGIPEVRDLILSGVKEILDRYDVDGILYDDYFYPYPSGNAAFDDDASYYAYGKGKQRADWRRENVNELIRRTDECVKASGTGRSFGVSPFGIWQNKSSDSRGSDTRGLESYSVLYCDTLAWIRGGWVDYLAPQLYWARGYDAADYSKLVRWWSAQLDGTKIKLAPALALYRVSEYSLGADEIIQQIQFLRSYMNSVGFLLFGYQDLAANTGGVADKLNEFLAYTYSSEEYFEGADNVKGVSFRYPGNGSKTTNSGTFILAASDPDHPVTLNGNPVGRTKSGFFSYYLPLSYGENVFTVEQGGVSYSLRVNRVSSSGGGSTKFAFQSLSPDRSETVAARSGQTVQLTASAPSGSTVTAYFNGQSVNLTASGSGTYQTYTGSIRMPQVEEGDEWEKIGAIVYTCSRGGQSVSASTGAVSVIPSNLHPVATVTKDYSFLKTGTTTSFYDDYLCTNIGMQDEVIEQRGEYYRLSFGGWIHRDNVSLSNENASFPAAQMGTVTSKIEGDRFNVTFPVTESVPLDVALNDRDFQIRLFLLRSAGEVELADNPLFSAAKRKIDGSSTVVTLTIRDLDHFYGWDYTYTESGIVFSFPMPKGLPEGDLPLSGKTVIVDAGHGGSDGGALGFLPGYDEKQLNLTVAKAVAEKLRSFGANVIEIRTDDSDVDLYKRMDIYDEIHPDFAISLHHNSVAETTDPMQGKGVWGLYWAYAGRGLTAPIQESVAEALGTYSFGVRRQKLAVCRNYKFPQTLIELGFICSPPEYERALRGDYAEVCAEAIAKGLFRYFADQDQYYKDWKNGK